MPVIVELWLF